MATEDKKIKLIIQFVLMLLGVGIIAILNNVASKQIITSVEIKNNKYLSAGDYLRFAHLQERRALKDVTFETIRDRLSKHPYIEFVDVYYSGDNKCTVIVHERKFDAIILGNNRQYLLDENLNIEPLLPFSDNVDLPIIENLKDRNKRINRSNGDLIIASKILYAVRLLNKNMYSDISEIDMGNGGDIVIRFSYNHYNLILGRGDEIKKIVYFNAIYGRMAKVGGARIIDYIDLRYDDQICFGFKPRILSYLEKQS